MEKDIYGKGYIRKKIYTEKDTGYKAIQGT